MPFSRYTIYLRFAVEPIKKWSLFDFCKFRIYKK